MRYIDQWLSGLGLDHIIPLLQEHGITTPNKLAQLSLRDMYEVVGVNDAEDRKKLYFLIQRLQSILKKGPSQDENETNEVESTATSHAQKESHQSEKHTEPILRQSSSNVPVSPLRSRPSEQESPGIGKIHSQPRHSLPDEEDFDDQEEEDNESSDLRILRRQHSSPASSPQRVVHQPALAIAVPTSSRSHNSDPPAQAPRNGRLSAPVITHNQKVTASHSIRAPSPIHVEESTIMTQPQRSKSNLRNPSSRQQNRHQEQVQEDLSDPAELEEDIPPPPSNKGRFIPTRSTPQMTIRKPVKLPTTPSRHSIAATQPYQQSPKMRNYRGRSQSPPPSPPPTPPPDEHGQRRMQDQQRRHVYNPSNYESGGSETVSSRKSMVNIQSQKSQVVISTRKNIEQQSTHYESNTQHTNFQYQNVSHPATQLSHEEAEYHEDVQDMAIRVIVKKRPVNRMDGKGDKDILEIRDGGHVIVHEPKTKVDLTKVVESTEFFFDDAFTELDTNELIYARAIRPLVNTALEGGKGSCFAYGQTGSGKTFTMMGSNPFAPAQVKINAGLYVLAARDIFRLLEAKARTARAMGEALQNYQVMVSCFEIYGGKLFDLLNDRGLIRCLEDSKQQVQIRGLTEHKVNNVDELLSMMAKAHEQRSTGSTGANLESSRSHQILQLAIQISTLGKNKKPTAFRKYGQLSFIDLAGSERGADTNNNSKQTRMEGAEINTSLLALKEVIRSLEKKNGYTPFRGSKLTQVLKDSFIGEMTRTCMVACVSPNMCNCEHTLNTLRYADRVKEHQSQSQNAPTRAKSDSVDESLMHGSDDYRGGNQRPATAQQYNTRDDLALESNYQSRPSTAHPNVKESNRRASLDRGYTGAGNAINYQPQPLTRALSIGATASRKSHRHQLSDEINGSNSRPSDNLRQTPIQTAGKKLEQSSSRPSVSAGGIRLLRGGNNNVPAPAPTRHPDYDMDPYQSMGKLPPPPPPETSNYDDNDDFNDDDDYDQQDSRRVGDDYDAEGLEDYEEENNLEDEEQEEQEEYEEENESDFPNDVDETDEPVIFDYDKSSSLGGTLMLQKTVNLVSAHKLAIAEMVEVMKEEMELVQTMEQASQRDSYSYVDQMDQILAAKLESINALRMELKSFQKYRMEVRAENR